MKTLHLVALGLVVLGAGCVNKDRWPFLGKWNGGFKADSYAGATPTDLKRWDMPGYVMLYATRWAFKLHLEAEQAIVDGKGSWAQRGNTIALTFTELKIDDKGGEEKRNPNRKFISAEAIRKAFGREIVFRLSADGKQIDTGLQSLEALLGSLAFTKAHKAEG